MIGCQPSSSSLSLAAAGIRSLSNLTAHPLSVTLSSNASTACHSISHILTTNVLP